MKDLRAFPLLLATALPCALTAQKPADLLFTNGKIVTIDAKFSTALS